jgi:type II secretory pathway pseudopilin PulG
VRRHGFSITELLVVVGIIVLLIGILLVAMQSVRARALSTRTITTMRGFGQACDAFQLEQGFYPGLVPETTLANDPQISGTENALLHLMGGAVTRQDVGNDAYTNNYPTGGNPGWVAYDIGGAFEFKVEFFKASGGDPTSPSRMGNGPVVNGVAYSPYFSPPDSDREFGFAAGQVNEGANVGGARLPDLFDAWGQPIVYLRQVRTVGPLVGDPSDRPQFVVGVMVPYLDSTSLGQLGVDQAESLFNVLDRNELLAQIIRHPAFGEPDQPLTSSARGAYVLISPGPDGVFFSQKQLPDPQNPGEVLQKPAIIEDFDDIIYFGGG